MGQFKDPEGESEVLEEATEYLIQQAIRLGDDEEDDLDSPIEQAQTFTPVSAAAQLEATDCPRAVLPRIVQHQLWATMQNAQRARRYGRAESQQCQETMPQRASLPAIDATIWARRSQAEEAEQHDSYSSEQLDIDVGPELSEEQVAQLALATARQSSTWGRIIRPPRKKGRHVILDLCTPLSALPQHRQAELSASRPAPSGAEGELGPLHGCGRHSGSIHASKLSSLSPVSLSADTLPERGIRRVHCLLHLLICYLFFAQVTRILQSMREQTEEGVLVRQVLAAADKKTWLGPAGYALARDSKWGDLWPSYYINRAIITKIESKPQ